MRTSFQQTSYILSCQLLGTYYVISFVLIPHLFLSPHIFFTHTFELTQFAHAPTNPNQLSVSNDVPKPTLDTTLRHSTPVREPLIHLQEYHYFSTIVFLVEPTSYQEASTNP